MNYKMFSTILYKTANSNRPGAQSILVKRTRYQHPSTGTYNYCVTYHNQIWMSAREPPAAGDP